MLIMFKVMNVLAITDIMASNICQNIAEQFLFARNGI